MTAYESIVAEVAEERLDRQALLGRREMLG